MPTREFAGELSLTGAVRPMRGAFAMACGTARAHAGAHATAEAHDERAAHPHNGIEASCTRTPELYLPAANAAEAALVPGVDVYAVTNLRALCAHLAGAADARLMPVPACTPDAVSGTPQLDMADVIGQRARAARSKWRRRVAIIY